jgi:hypothetical protein
MPATGQFAQFFLVRRHGRGRMRAGWVRAGWVRAGRGRPAGVGVAGHRMAGAGRDGDGVRVARVAGRAGSWRVPGAAVLAGWISGVLGGGIPS